MGVWTLFLSQEDRVKHKSSSHFSSRQQAVFALASNWAQNQFENAIKTQHFHNLGEKLRIFQDDDKSLIKERVDMLRNFVSHGMHDPLPPLTQDGIERFKEILKRHPVS